MLLLIWRALANCPQLTAMIHSYNLLARHRRLFFKKFLLTVPTSSKKKEFNSATTERCNWSFRSVCLSLILIFSFSEQCLCALKEKPRCRKKLSHKNVKPESGIERPIETVKLCLCELMRRRVQLWNKTWRICARKTVNWIRVEETWRPQRINSKTCTNANANLK